MPACSGRQPASALFPPPDRRGLTFQGVKALGVPQESLNSFSPEFQEGMAARADILGDVGESSPGNWDKPFGSRDVHAVLALTSSEEAARLVRK
ncbi:hypothetical protein [Streptomyces sp. NPDC058299]|uniref:hypothetical protein n=1 Tax=unclassified Streptomyces TaxID=2593676 RepID=UPI0036EE23DA